MPFTLATVLADAWALFRRDRDLLVRLAGPFLFLPAFALLLLVPSPPVPPAGGATAEAQALAWADAVQAWVGAHGLSYLLAYALNWYGSAAILATYLDPAAGSVGTALGRAGRVLPRYLLAMLLVAVPAGAGLLLYVLPGLYILGRVAMTGPALVAEQPVGVRGAIGRSLALTRGRGLVMTTLVATPVVGGFLLEQPLLALDLALRSGEPSRPLVALADAAAAVVAAAAALAQLLIAVAVYRRLAR